MLSALVAALLYPVSFLGFRRSPRHGAGLPPPPAERLDSTVTLEGRGPDRVHGAMSRHSGPRGSIFTLKFKILFHNRIIKCYIVAMVFMLHGRLFAHRFTGYQFCKRVSLILCLKSRQFQIREDKTDAHACRCSTPATICF